MINLELTLSVRSRTSLTNPLSKTHHPGLQINLRVPSRRATDKHATTEKTDTQLTRGEETDFLVLPSETIMAVVSRGAGAFIFWPGGRVRPEQNA